MALKISKSGRGKSRGGEAEALSSEQPIECVFADMSDKLMKIQRDLLMPAFIFENEQVQNTITFFGSARIKPEEKALAELKEVQSDAKLEGADRREARSGLTVAG